MASPGLECFEVGSGDARRGPVYKFNGCRTLWYGVSATPTVRLCRGTSPARSAATFATLSTTSRHCTPSSAALQDFGPAYRRLGSQPAVTASQHWRPVMF